MTEHPKPKYSNGFRKFVRILSYIGIAYVVCVYVFIIIGVMTDDGNASVRAPVSSVSIASPADNVRVQDLKPGRYTTRFVNPYDDESIWPDDALECRYGFRNKAGIPVDVRHLQSGESGSITIPKQETASRYEFFSTPTCADFVIER